MNKKLLTSMLAILLLIGAGLAYVMLQKSMNVEPNKNPTDNTRAQEHQGQSPSPTKGAYVDYSENDFTSTQGTRLLFFHAPWCPQCRALDASIKTSEIPAGVTIFKVDYDTNQALRAKYGVTLQTTIVKVNAKGNKIDSYVAYDEPIFHSLKEALLP
ncbi:MAG TPA: thioredoxin family protein [Candidatus Saccharimonadales bacterium]